MVGGGLQTGAMSGGAAGAGGISATGAGVPSVRMKPSNPAACVTSRKRASSELTMNVCGTSRGPNTKEPAGATTVWPATQIVSSPSRT